MDILDTVTIKSIVGIFTVPTHKGRALTMHRRPTYALSFSRDTGVIRYTHLGKDTISDKYHAVILPMGESYTLFNHEGGDFPIINFTTTDPFTREFLSYEIKNPDSYLKVFDRMVDLAIHEKNRNKVMSLLYDVLNSLARENEAKDPVIIGAVEFMNKNLCDPNLSNTEIAKRAHVSEIYFRRLFKSNYGTTPKQYILNLRIARAKDLLAEGGTSIAKVAEVCGFSSVYHFSRAFKAFTGISATDYSKNCNQQIQGEFYEKIHNGI